MTTQKLCVSLCLLLFLPCCTSREDSQAQNLNQQALAAGQNGLLPFKSGETIRYAIKSMGVKAGEATLSFKGEADYLGEKAYLIVFTASAVNFFDEEKIYAHRENFYPIAVERNLNIWGAKEKITEKYDQKKGILDITKLKNGRTTSERIKKSGMIDNIYCFLYRYRTKGELQIGDALAMRLPTKDVVLNLKKTTQLKTAGKVYDAYFMESQPPKYKIWFDSKGAKVPLRINGAVGINDTAMIMVEYAEGK